MNKEYDNKNKGALFLSDKTTQKGDHFYTGKIDINGVETPITMFINESENPKAPKFRLTVNEFKKDVSPQDFAPKEDVLEDFGKSITEEDLSSDLPF